MLKQRARTAFDRGASAELSRRPVSSLTRRRGGAFAMLWHRIGPEGARPHEVVPTVPLGRFGAQLEVLTSMGRVVPLAQLDADPRADGLRFALTFDDDDAGHVRWTLPLLEERGLPATFFPSGRWGPDRGPYGWEALEARVARQGLARIAETFGLTSARSARELAAQLTGTDATCRLETDARSIGPPPLELHDARSIAAAGHEIGYHTRRHPSLSTLSEPCIRRAVADGRASMPDELGVDLERFAYPQGHVDGRTGAAVRGAGYRSSRTIAKRPVRPEDDPVLRGRWDLASADASALRGRLTRAVWRRRPRPTALT